MRKLTAGNKKSFAIFTIIIIGIIAILIWCLSMVLKMPKEEYIIESDNFLYDEEYNPIQLEEEATIQKKWTGSYYLKTNDTNEEYKLGTQCVAYQESTKTVNLYGKMYRIYTDGAVAKLTQNTTISKTSEDQLYKLGDRKYIVIGNTITNETGSLSTTGYLLVLIDKAGNTYLLNNELNSRTIKPMVINTQTFKFDVANEKLIYNDEEIDLKKIIGSTNQYVKPEEKQEPATIIQSTNNQSTVINNGSTITNNQSTTTNNQSTIINNNTTINNQQNNTNINIETDNNGTEKTELAKSVQLRGTSTGSTYIDVEYNVIDPENKYQTVYLLVDGAGTAKTIALDKQENKYRITGLNQNQEYKITLGTKQINDEGILEESIEDITSARTTKVTSTLKITKITLTKIYFELILDKNQNIDEAEIVLYVDGEAKERTQVDLEKSATTAGWTGSLDYHYGKDIILKIENAKFDGKAIQINIQAKAKNY